MRIQFIGTGSGKTSLKRNHSSILIDTLDSKLLIDCGDGISKALLKNEIKFNSIDSILFTHYHADHFSGISSLITQMKLNDRKNELKIFTHKNLIEPLKDFLHTCYLFEDKLEFEIQFFGYDFDQEYKVDSKLSFTTKQNSHISNKYQVTSIPQNRFVSASILLKSEKKEIIYTSDIEKKEDLFLFDKFEPTIYITETTHIELEWLSEVVNFYRPKQIFLTHISDEDEEKIVKFLNNQTFSHISKIDIVEDGQYVTLSRDFT